MLWLIILIALFLTVGDIPIGTKEVEHYYEYESELDKIEQRKREQRKEN